MKTMTVLEFVQWLRDRAAMDRSLGYEGVAQVTEYIADKAEKELGDAPSLAALITALGATDYDDAMQNAKELSK